MVLPSIQKLLAGIHLRDKHALRVTEEPKLSRCDLFPRQHGKTPELDDRQLSMSARIQGHANDPIATITRMLFKRRAGTVQSKHNPRDRARRHDAKQ